MSITEPLGDNPIPQSDAPNPPEFLNYPANSTPTDPLLQSGSFIDPTGDPEDQQILGGAQNGDVHRQESRQPEPVPFQNDDPVAGVSNGADGGTPASRIPSSRRKNKVMEGSAAADLVPERPDWLPEGWTMQCTLRSSGATAGTTDKYYIEPVKGRRFRSKNEVLYFMETGMRKRKPDADAVSSESPGGQKQKKSSESPGGSKQKKSGPKKKKPLVPPPNFDFEDIPDSVKWVLEDAVSNKWTPYINGVKVPESTQKEWEAANEYLDALEAARTEK